MYALAHHPDIQEKVYADVLKHAPVMVDNIGVEHVGKMEYLSAFLQEVLRLYPPAGFFPRTARFKENLGGVEVPAGTRIGLSPHLMHRDPKIWDEPELFSPERWINVTAAEQERRRFAFFPFSLGGRNCIGQHFATIEAQLIVALLVRACRVDVAPSQKDTELTFATVITMKSKPRFRFTVHDRTAS